MGIGKMEDYLAGKSDGFAQMLREHDESPVLQEVGRTIPQVVMAGRSERGYQQLAKKGWRPVAGRAAASATGMAGTNALMTGLMERRAPTLKETEQAAASGAAYGGIIGKEKDQLDFTKPRAKARTPEELDFTKPKLISRNGDKTYNELELNNEKKDNKLYEDGIRINPKTVPVRNQRGIPATRNQSVEGEQQSNAERDRSGNPSDAGRRIVSSQKWLNSAADSVSGPGSNLEYVNSHLDKALANLRKRIEASGARIERNSIYHRALAYLPEEKTIHVNPTLLAHHLRWSKEFGIDPQSRIRAALIEEITHHEIDTDILKQGLDPDVVYWNTYAKLSVPQKTILEGV